MPVALQIAGGNAGSGLSARLYYRHVNQAERWVSAEMSRENGKYTAAIPADYTNSKFPLEYYFALERQSEAAWMYPGFNSTLSNQPYFAISKRAI
jgi:hypothetical protein